MIETDGNGYAVTLFHAALLPMIAVLARHERSFGPIRGGRTVPKARVVAGVALICVGLAATAGVTITSPDNLLGIRVSVVAAPFLARPCWGSGRSTT